MPSPSVNRLANLSLLLALLGWAAFLLQGCFDLTVGLLLSMLTAGTSAVCATVLDFLPFILWISGIVSGHVALGQVRQSGESGRSRAVAGLVLGYLGLSFILIFIAVLLILLAAGIKMGWLQKLVPGLH